MCLSPPGNRVTENEDYRENPGSPSEGSSSDRLRPMWVTRFRVSVVPSRPHTATQVRRVSSDP